MRIACLLGPSFEDSEFRYPYDQFRAHGHTVVVIGTEQGQSLKGDKGREQVFTEASIDDVSPRDYDALFIPGGGSPDKLRADERIVDFARAFSDRPIFAICHGPQLLITAEMVEGREMTAWKTVQVDLKNAGAHVRDEKVVVDDNLVTSRQPTDLPAFVEKALGLLETQATDSLAAAVSVH